MWRCRELILIPIKELNLFFYYYSDNVVNSIKELNLIFLFILADIAINSDKEINSVI